jgi:predicted transcriptional regulator
MSSVSVAEIVSKLKTVFGLNHSQIANLIGVSHRVLRDYIYARAFPSSMLSYLQWWQLANEVERSISVDIKPGLKSVRVNGKTLLTWLFEKDSTSIIDACKEINNKLSKNPPKTPSVNEQRLTARLHSVMS